MINTVQGKTMKNIYDAPHSLVKRLNLTEEKRQNLEDQWKKTLDRIEREKVTNPEKYNISEDELFRRIEILNKKLDNFIYENK